jgi:hypothetical protein
VLLAYGSTFVQECGQSQIAVKSYILRSLVIFAKGALNIVVLKDKIVKWALKNQTDNYVKDNYGQ